MQRLTWRDVVVDVVALLILFGAVLLGLWDMRSAAPWMVAVVAGRWGASSMAKLAVARQGSPPARQPSDPPPPAGGASPEVEGQEEKKPLPSSAIVMLIFALGALALRAFFWFKRNSA